MASRLPKSKTRVSTHTEAMRSASWSMSTSCELKAEGILISSRRSRSVSASSSPAARLVHQNEFGPADQGFGDFDHASVEKVQLPAQYMALGAKTDKLQCRLDLAAGAGAVAGDVVGDRLNVFNRRQIVDYKFLLKSAAQADADAAVRRKL